MKIPFFSQFFKSRDKPQNYYIGTDFRFKGERWGVHLHSWLKSYLIRGRASIFSTASFLVGKASILQVYYSKNL